jgi:hypothetical protein
VGVCIANHQNTAESSDEISQESFDVAEWDDACDGTCLSSESHNQATQTSSNLEVRWMARDGTGELAETTWGSI